MCVSSWTLYTAKHQPADLFTKAVWSHLLSSHDAPALFLFVSVLLTRVVHSHFICHRAATSVCVYTVCIETERSDEECFDADRALNPPLSSYM